MINFCPPSAPITARKALKTCCKAGGPNNQVGAVSSTVPGVTVPPRAPIAPKPSAASAPVTHSLPAAAPRRDGLVHRLVDAEDFRQPGDPEDLQDPLLRADQIQRAVVGPHPLQAPDQHPEAGGVEEPDLVQVDDELVLPVLTKSMSSSRSRGAVYMSISPCTSMTSMPSVAW